MGFGPVERVYGSDLMLAVCELSVEKGYRHFFYGGAPGVAEILATRCRHGFSGCRWSGWRLPPFAP
jgi:N-acetylglucosaminyldiphosphoundecaprenol N-acetyl-beta-D-mannosaminyltransferase